MTDTIQNNQPETTQIEQIEKKKRGRKPQGENGTKMSLDPQYFNNYYKEKLSMKVECDICSSTIAKGNLLSHKKGQKCKIIGLLKSQITPI